MAEAHDRGLDFVALTDHNNVVNQHDPSALAWQRSHPAFIVVPGYENSQAGHVQMLGARRCYGNHGALRHRTIECDAAVDDRSSRGMHAVARGLRRAGGVFQINHPSDRSWLGAYQRTLVPDTVEVWNIGPWAFQSPLPSSNDNDFSLRWYDGFLRRGDQVAVTGGSDSHWRSTDAVQGIGDPTTWVFVRHRTVRGVLAGLRAHHTYVSTLPPSEAGPRLLLEADTDHDGGFEAIPGSTSTQRATYRLETVNALPGSQVRIVTDRGEVQLPLPASGTLTFELGRDGVPHAARFVRAELLADDAKQLRAAGCDAFVGSRSTLCRNDLAMESLTSPIFIPSRPPA
ncbi:MAG: CehA/McbA family metallohydrolase [Frankiaceae bacterium]|nr:CehA/McbA family metallohydrolase [Frankiaceae bacterium]